MEKKVYDELVAQVDHELRDAKCRAIDRERREAKEKAREMLRIQRQVLQAKLAVFARFGARPTTDLPALIDRLKEEERSLEEELALLGGLDAAALVPMPVRESRALATVQDLITELRTTRLADLPADTALALARVWALRWRNLAERVGQRQTRDDRLMRVAYALIRERMESCATRLPYIPALNSRARADWESELELALEELHRIRPHAESPGWKEALRDAAAELGVVLPPATQARESAA